MTQRFHQIKSLFIQYKVPVIYSGTSIFKALAQILVGFVIAKYVLPEDFGIWSTINLAVTYALFLQAGLINGLNLELPFAYGKNQEATANDLAGTVQFFTVISSVIVLIIGLSYQLFWADSNSKIRYGALAITVVIIFTFYQNYLISTFRSASSFLKLSTIQITEALTNILTLLFVIYFSYYGLLIKAVLVIVTYVTLLHIKRPIKIGLNWNTKTFLNLLKVGLPIFALGYSESVSATFDRIWLLKFSDLSDVGLYSFSLYGLTLFTLFSTSIASYIYPRMTYNYGLKKDKLILWKYVKKVTIILFSLLIIIAAVGSYLIPLIVPKFFPQYLQSIEPMQILFFAGAFKGSVVGVNVLWSIKSWRHMIIYQLGYSILLISLPYIFIQVLQNKIIAVAIGVLIANFINLFSGFYLSYFATHIKTPKTQNERIDDSNVS